MKVALTVFILIASTLLFGCRTKEGRTIYDIDSPWNSPETKAVTIEQSYLYYMAVGLCSDLYWTESSGREISVSKNARKLDKYLLKNGYIDSWPDSRFGIGRIQLKISPYRIFFVSIDPVIVIMVPWISSDGVSRYLDEMDAHPRQKFGSKYLLYSFEFGTRIPYASDVIALHLDKRLERTIQLDPQDDRTSIEFDDVSLDLVRHNTIWVIRRTR